MSNVTSAPSEVVAPKQHSGWWGVKVGDYWLEDGAGNLFAHQSKEVMVAKCNQLRNSLATVEEF